MPEITPAQLAEWRAAREKASPGEWQADVRVGCAAVYPGEHRNCLDGVAADGAIAWHKGYWDEEERCWRVDDQRVTDFQFIALAANNWIGLLDEITRLQAECDRLRKLARELTLLAVEAGEAYKSLHFKWLVNNSALWLAADALHRNDTPRDTETDDVQEWRQQAEDSERTREENDANTIPIILELIRVKLARPDVKALGEEIDG